MTTFATPKNWAVSTLAVLCEADALTITVAEGEGDLFGDAFPVVVILDFDLALKREITLATSRVDDVITVTRAQEGTTARVHAVGASVRCNLTAGQLSAIHTAINAIETDLTIPNVDDATEKALLTPVTGKVCYQKDTKTFEICTEEA